MSKARQDDSTISYLISDLSIRLRLGPEIRQGRRFDCDRNGALRSTQL